MRVNISRGQLAAYSIVGLILCSVSGLDVGPGVKDRTYIDYYTFNSNLKENNILLNNPVESHLPNTRSLVDGDINSIQFPTYSGDEKVDSKFYRYYGISLEGVYRLETINIYFGSAPRYLYNNYFDVYIAWDVNLCNEKENFLNFRLIARKVRSYQPGQVTILSLNKTSVWDAQMTARYIVLASGDPYNFRNRARNFTLAEITATGKSVAEYKHEEIEDRTFDVELPIYLRWQKEVFEELKDIQNWRRSLFQPPPDSNFTKILVRPSDGFLTPIDYYHSCILAMDDSCLAMIGVYRAKFRFAISVGSSLFPVVNEPFRKKYNNIPLYSVLKWLCYNCTRPRITFKTENNQNGRILYLPSWTEKPKDIIKLISANVTLILHLPSVRDATYDQLRLLRKLYIDYSSENAFEKYGSVYEYENVDLDQMVFEKMPTSLRIIRRVVNDPVEHWHLSLNFGKHRFEGLWANHLRKKMLKDDWADKKVEKIMEMAKFFGPCRCKPLKKGPKRQVLNTIRNLKENGLIQKKIILPGSSYFPGIVRPHARVLNKVQLSIDIIDSNSRIYLGYGLSSTQPWSYRVIDGYPSVWRIQIGCTTDDIEHKDQIKRWSRVTTNDLLKKSQNETYHPFGGLIYLNFLGANKEDGFLKIELNGVFRAARFNRRLRNAEDIWDQTKDETDFPWVELEGDTHNHCVQMEYAYEANGAQLAETTKTFDNWVKINHFFVGSDWRKARNEVAVFDIETAFSYGHSGYPWVCEADWFEFVSDPKKMTREKGAWGFCHEIGHNFEKDYWRVQGAEESFNNLFCLVDYNYTKVMNVFKPHSLMFKQTEIVELIRHWINPRWPLNGKVLLTYYNYLGWKFGAGLMGNALYQIRLDHQQGSNKNLTTEEHWILTLSKQTGYDFGPFHRLMGWPMSEVLRSQLSELPCWLPNDEFTSTVSNTIRRIEKDFKKKCSSIERHIPPYFRYDQDNDYTRRYFYVRNY